MKEYTVQNITSVFSKPEKVQANSPLAAVKKLYPEYQIKRDNKGDIVVYGYAETRTGCYRSYVYSILKAVN